MFKERQVFILTSSCLITYCFPPFHNTKEKQVSLHPTNPPKPASSKAQAHLNTPPPIVPPNQSTNPFPLSQKPPNPSPSRPRTRPRKKNLRSDHSKLRQVTRHQTLWHAVQRCVTLIWGHGEKVFRLLV